MNKSKNFAQIQSRLIVALILFVLPLGLLLSVAADLRKNGSFNPFSPLMLVIYVGITAVMSFYFLRPIKNYKVVFLTIFVLSAAVIIANTQLVAIQEAHFPLYYLLLPVLLSTIFISSKQVAYIGLVLLLIATLISFTFREVSFATSFFGPISFLLVGFICLLLSTRYREMLDGIYFADLAAKEAQQAKRAEELLQLHQTSLAMTQEPVLVDALQTIIDKATSLLPLKAGEVLLVKNNRVVPIATSKSSPWTPEMMGSVQFGEGLAGKVAQVGHTITIPNYGRWGNRVVHSFSEQVGRAIGVPLVYKSEILGVINLFDLERRGDFSDDEVRLLEMFAAQAAIVIQNVRWRESLEQANNSLEAEVKVQTYHLQEAHDRLLQLDRIRAKMIDDISHELRTPITNLILYTDLMAKGVKEKQDTYLAVIKREGDHLSELVENVLRLSRLQLSSDSVLSEGIKLHDVVTSLVEEMRGDAVEKQLRLRYEAASSLPLLIGNEKQLYEMVKNLIQNSLLYTEKGEILVKTAVSLDNKFVELTVQDSGIGIPEDEQIKVFDRLYRGTAVAQRHIRGVGLGLSLVKDIVDLHRGHIDLQSQVGVGTTITVSLPAAESE